MLFYRFSYLRFWLTATDQHGVHSPFIYRYVTQCLYSRPHFKVGGPTNILLKTLAYFNLDEIQLITDDRHIEQQLGVHTNGVSITATSQKLIYLDVLDQEALDKYLIYNKDIHQDTLVFIPKLYGSRERYAFWKKIIGLEKVTVSVDMFYGGLIFFRSGQAKEHFKIRI